MLLLMYMYSTCIGKCVYVLYYTVCSLTPIERKSGMDVSYEGDGEGVWVVVGRGWGGGMGGVTGPVWHTAQTWKHENGNKEKLCFRLLDGGGGISPQIPTPPLYSPCPIPVIPHSTPSSSLPEHPHCNVYWTKRPNYPMYHTAGIY
jgi:hypothetical protein